ELIYVCPECGYMATSEKTDFFISEETFIKEESSPVESVFTPGKKTIEEVTAFMGEEPTSFAKTLLFKTDGKPVAALVRGDRELNPHKIKKLLNVKKLEMADDKLVEKVTGAPVGFAGPVGLGKIPVLADLEVKNMQSLIVGANKGDYHIKNVMPGRDFNISHYGDLRMAATGDLCKNCKKLLEVKSAFKLAEGFKIEDKYTEPMKATFFDEQSKEHKIIMGSYSLNISQTMAAIVETHHDENGIIWPSSVSPFDVIVLLLEPSDEKQKEIALNIYNFLKKEGVDVLLDDRDSRAGFKFKDADLLGIPLRITVGYKAVKEGLVELKIRRKNKNIVFPVQEVISEVKNLFKM
ncbi:MAG TPA: YbaK/EbsC family protein, partial [Candidatus Eremiobacteraeota bacterium]|nr:YbaK/EbsC family protein [Candidatus Eremiobacteraeota bacterium]